MSELKKIITREQGLVHSHPRRIFLGTMAAGSALGLSGCSLMDIFSGDFFSSFKDTEETDKLVQGKGPAPTSPAPTSEEAAAPKVASNGKALPLDRFDARFVSFQNTHTGESTKVTYWEQGKYLPDGLAEINKILRDHRTNDVTKMDPKLIDQLFVLRQKLDTNQPFQIISGYRSPKTNAMLRANGRGVARHSLHMTGQAIDIRVQGRSLSQVRLAALSLSAGGVGYYPGPQFVHMDTGRVRRW